MGIAGSGSYFQTIELRSNWPTACGTLSLSGDQTKSSRLKIETGERLIL